MIWHKFDESKGYRQKRPPLYKRVLVRIIPAIENEPIPVAVGYRKNNSGNKSLPYFVIPGIGGKVFEWCDCLPEIFANSYIDKTNYKK